MLDWDDFRVFLSVARAGTLSGAARVLQVNQSTMSRRLAALEASAGARLFDRTPDGYLLTAAGEAVRGHVEDLESKALGIERQLLGHDARPSGPVRLALSDSFASWFLVPRLHGLLASYPGISLELVAGNPAVNLARREADISLRLSKPQEPNLIARRLGEAAWAVYGSSAYLARHAKPSVRKRLRGQQLIALDSELRGTVGARWLAAHGSHAEISLTCNTLIAQAAAVVAGLGISPMPCLFGDQQAGLVRALPRSIGAHAIWLVVHPDVRSSARVRAVMDYLTELVTSHASLLSGTADRKTGAGFWESRA
jgi:DNA-binding transcriptional LysR family regulator